MVNERNVATMGTGITANINNYRKSANVRCVTLAFVISSTTPSNTVIGTLNDDGKFPSYLVASTLFNGSAGTDAGVAWLTTSGQIKNSNSLTAGLYYANFVYIK